jgi:hypothetical protein
MVVDLGNKKRRIFKYYASRFGNYNTLLKLPFDEKVLRKLNQ